MSSDHSDIDILDALAEEFVERYRQGERPSIAEYEAKCPPHAAEIRELFPALVVMEQAASIDEEQGTEQQQTIGLQPQPRGTEQPEQLGDYRIIREIGRGGMGVVYEAEQLSLGRYVALKVLPQQLMLGARERRRFEREAKAAAKLHHTNIVPVFGVGEQDGLQYYVMQFIQGLGLDGVLAELKTIWQEGGISGDLPSNLQVTERRSGSDAAEFTAQQVARTLANGQLSVSQRERMTTDVEDESKTSSILTGSGQTGRLSDSFALLSSSSETLPQLNGSTVTKDTSSQQSYWLSVARIGLQVAGGLQYAHEQGILHRDIKPSNLLLDTNGTVWITDFGLAKSDDQDNLTHTGDILGTLRYMAPELFSGRADVRSEVYALGLTLYEMLTLRPAFNEKDRNRLIKQVTSESPQRVERITPRIPRDLGIIVNKAVEFDPAHRYQSAGEMADDLQRFINDEPIRARRTSIVERFQRWARHNTAVAAALVAVLVLLLLMAAGSSIAAIKFERLAKNNENLADQKEIARYKAVEAQAAAEASRRRMQIALSDIATSNGLIAATQAERPAAESAAPVEGHDDSAEAVLWFANAAKYGGVDPDRNLANRIRVQNWLRETILPVRALQHSSSLRSIDFDASGQYLLAVGFERSVVWDWKAETPLPWMDGNRRISAAAWSPDGQQLALAIPAESEQEAGKVEIRSVPGGDVIHDFEHEKSINSLLFSPDGKHVAVASTHLEVRDCESGKLLVAWQHPEEQQLHSLIFNSRGDQLAAASRDKLVRVFAVPGPANDSSSSAEPLYPPIEHQAESPPAYIDGGSGLISVVGYRQLLWSDAQTGKPARWKRFKTKQEMFTTLEASPDGRRFAAGGYVSVYEWNIDSDSPQEFHRRHRNHTMDVAYSHDGTQLLTSSWDGKAKLWTREGERIGQPLFHQGKVVNVAYSPTGQHIATAQGDGLVRVWSLPEGVSRDHAMRVKPGDITARLSPDGRFAFATRFDSFGWAYRTKQVQVFDVASGQPAGPLLPLSGQMRDAAVSPDGKMIATVSRTDDMKSGFLEFWDFRSGRRLLAAVPIDADPQAIDFSPDNSCVAVYCLRGPLLVIDAKSGEEKLRIRHDALLNPMHTRAVRFLPDGKSFVAIGPDAVSVWDLQSGELRFAPIRPGVKLKGAIATDGTFIATGTHVKNLLQVWSLRTGESLCAAIPHPDHIFQLRISNDGKFIFTACRDGQARLWDWRAAELVCPPLDHPDEVNDVALTPDGRWGLTACRDSAVRIWEFTTGKEIAPRIRCGTKNATSVETTLQGTRAVLGGLGSTLRSINLADRLSPPDLSLDELCLLAEIVSGQQIHDGNLSRLSSADWLARWERFRAGRTLVSSDSN